MKSVAHDPEGHRLGWPRTIANAFALLFLAFTGWHLAYVVSHNLGTDFVSLYAAGKLASNGHASLAYDLAAHRSVEKVIAPQVGFLPFAYPPPMLALLVPFVQVPCGMAQTFWVLCTGALFFAAARRFAPLSYAFANPINFLDSFAGQTGFLVGGIFLVGLRLIESAPFAAGAVLGVLILKPQLAVILPVATIASRRWRVIGGAAASSITILLFGLLLFGIDSYLGFLAMAQQFGAMMRDSRWPWAELVSPFALFRYFGTPLIPALALHVILASTAAAIVWVAWSREWQEKIPILASATLLGSPYLFTYDATLMILPAGYLVAQRRYWAVGVLWLLCALPALFPFKLYHGPNTIPLGSALSIFLLLWGHVSVPSQRAARLRLKQEVRN
jgi:hypothetical protein